MNLEECEEFVKETDCKHLLLGILELLFWQSTSVVITTDFLYAKTGHFSFDSCKNHYLEEIPFYYKLTSIWDSFLENPELLGLTLEKLLAPVDIKVSTRKEKRGSKQEYVIIITFDKMLSSKEICETLLYKAFKSYFTKK